MVCKVAQTNNRTPKGGHDAKAFANSFFAAFLLLPTSYSKDESTEDSSQSIQDGSDDSRLKKFCFESFGYLNSESQESDLIDNTHQY